MRKKAPKNGEEFSEYDGIETYEIYEELDHKDLIISVCKVLTLNELEMIIFMLFINKAGWFPGFLRNSFHCMKDFS